MEKLHKRSDGYSETSEGFFAVFPLRKNAVVQRADGVYNVFDFMPSFQSDTIRVEWPVESAIALFPSDVSIIMIRLGHARNLTTEEVEQYNSSIDFLDGKEPEPVAEPPKEPEPVAEPPKEPEPVAEGEETPADEKPADEKPADVQADEKPGEDETEEKKKAGRPKKAVAIPGLTN